MSNGQTKINAQSSSFLTWHLVVLKQIDRINFTVSQNIVGSKDDDFECATTLGICYAVRDLEVLLVPHLGEEYYAKAKGIKNKIFGRTKTDGTGKTTFRWYGGIFGCNECVQYAMEWFELLVLQLSKLGFFTERETGPEEAEESKVEE